MGLHNGGRGSGMVEFVGVERMCEMVARITPAIFMEQMAAEIESDYRRWEAFKKSARHATHSPEGVIELMPASDGQFYSFKYVNGHPKNTASGRLTVMAFGVLAEVGSGYPLLLSELTLVTALRTAATSALAARHMARPSCRVMALIGNGAQSEFQAIAFHHMLGIRELRLYDVDPEATVKLERNLVALRLDQLEVVRCRAVHEAVRGADIVTTATADKRNAFILTPNMVTPGMHLNAIGGDCPGKTELHPGILLRTDARVVVEYEPQSRVEGEIQRLEMGFPVIELSEVLSGRLPGRSSADEITIFDSVGFALEDFSALRYLHRLLLRDGGKSQRIDLIPDLSNPKDLYGLLVPRIESPPRASDAPAAPCGASA